MVPVGAGVVAGTLVSAGVAAGAGVVAGASVGAAAGTTPISAAFGVGIPLTMAEASEVLMPTTAGVGEEWAGEEWAGVVSILGSLTIAAWLSGLLHETE